MTYGRTAYTWPTIGHGTFRFRRILVVQTQRMGDVLCATPLITGLRSQFPEAHIGALVQKQNAPVLIGNPHLNEIVAYDAEQMRRSLLSRLRFIGELRNRDYDLCLSIHASNTIGFTLWQSAIPWRICVWRYGAEKRPPWAMMFHQHIRQKRHKGTLHEIEHNLNVLRELRMDPGSPTYSVTLHPTELDWSRGFLQERGLLAGRPMAVIHPGHGGGRQEWPAEYYTQVGTGLARRGWQVAVTGTSKESHLVNRVISGMEGNPVSLAGALDLRQFAAVLAHARLFVSVSTGPMHLASAVGVPTVTMYGPTDLAIEATRFCPYGTVALPVRSPVTCPCAASRVCTDPVCMTGLRPELVLGAVDQLQEGAA